MVTRKVSYLIYWLLSFPEYISLSLLGINTQINEKWKICFLLVPIKLDCVY